MSVWILFLLCIVQGLTEFLPVSSSGHLLFFEQIFCVQENNMLINLFLHVATLLAVIIVYRRTIINFFKKPFQTYTMKLLLATSFTVLLAFAYEFLGLERWITKIYPFGFLLTSILLFACHMFQKKTVRFNMNQITCKQSILVGLVQGVAVVPGLSRSGSTISSMILSGVEEKQASEFSFLLSVPIILGGFILEIFKIKNNNFSSLDFSFWIYIVAFIVTFFVSMIALKLTIKLLKKQKFIVFSIYTFVMFIVTFVLNYII